MAIVPNTSNSYTGDGTTTLWAFDFPYEQGSDVVVTVDGVVTSYTFSTPSIVSIVPAPASGTDIVIYRNTPANVMKYTFTDGVPFLTRFADINWRQLLYVFQEGINTAIEALSRHLKAIRTPEDISELPDAASRANKLLAFDADGNPIVSLYLAGSIPDLDNRLQLVEASSIDNIADLRLARAATNGQKFSVTSYNSGWAASLKPPVGGGVFTYVATDTTSAEDYGHIIVGADGKRYYRDGVDCVNVQHFGAIGDGSDQTTAINRAIAAWDAKLTGGFAAQYPAAFSMPLYFPAGRYRAPGVNIRPSSTGGFIYGDGPNSQLDGIGIHLDQYRSGCANLFLRGTGDYGLKLSSDAGYGPHYITINNMWIRDKTIGLELNGEFAWDNLSNLHIERCGRNLSLIECLGVHISNSTFTTPTGDYNIYIESGGELKLSNCLAMNGVGANMYITGSTAKNTVEHYFNQCTFTGCQPRTLTITNISDAGGGLLYVDFSAPHQFQPKMTGLTLAGTTHYDATYDIVDVISTTRITITGTYVSTISTGTASIAGWDVIIDVNGGDPLTRTNDVFFRGGNINYLKINKGFNITFHGTRLKNHIWLEDGNVNHINIVRDGRGRLSDSFTDAQVAGAKTGWAEVVFYEGSTSASPGTGGVGLRTPDKNQALGANNLPVLNYVLLSESQVLLKANSKTLTLGSTGIDATSLGGRNSGVIADDAAYSFTPDFPSGRIFISDGGGRVTRYADFCYNTATPIVETAGFSGATMAVATGPLTGTTGADGKITVSAHTDGKIYIENRSGSSRTMYWQTVR